MAKDGLYEKAKGRRRYDPHVRIYHFILPTLMERLSGNAVKVLIYMLSHENGEHKGVFMGARQAAAGCKISPNTANKALIELDQRGFIRPIEMGFFQVKGGPATRWRMTFLPFGGKGPSNEWRDPPAQNKSWSQKLNGAVAEIEQRIDDQGAAVAKTETVEPVSHEIAVADIETQITTTIDSEASERPATDLDPILADGPDESRDALLAARAVIARHWCALRTAARRRAWTQSHGLTTDELRLFVAGDPTSLPFPKVAALASAARAAR